jgi:hypothetical protein
MLMVTVTQMAPLLLLMVTLCGKETASKYQHNKVSVGNVCQEFG